jgi:hypothetical protein
MNVRRTTITTFSIIAVICGFCFLIPEVRHILPNQARRLSYKQYYIGGYHSFILSASAWLIAAVGIIDAILNNRVALDLLSSLNIPIVLIITTFIFLFIPVNDYIFWGLIYIVLIFGIFWTFRKFVSNNHPGSRRLIRFIKEIRVGIAEGSNHISDRYTVFGISILLAGVYALLIVSLVIYVITYWGMFT